MAPKTSPAINASGGEAHGVRQNARPNVNRIFDLMKNGSTSAKRFLFYSWKLPSSGGSEKRGK
jgi:hypothetical protein